MKHRLLPVFAAILLSSSAVSAFACEHEQKTSAAATKAAAASKAYTAQVAQASKAGSACCMSSAATAVTANQKAGSAAGCAAHGASAAQASAVAKTSAVTADAGACRAYGVAIVTSSAGTGCAYRKNATSAAAAGARVDAVLTGGSSCHAGQATTAQGDHDCDACAELALCDGELQRIGFETQVVPLKNGVMIVYTARANGSAQAIQLAMARRNDRVSAVTASGERAKLCGECKTMRGAMASGKLTRETVNIGGGVLTVMTSSDPKMVAKLQAIAASSKT